jgi:hypothetical protein
MPEVYEFYIQRLVAEEEARRQDDWTRCINTSFDEPPTRATLSSIARMAESECWYRIFRWNRDHEDRPFVLDCDDLRAARDAGMSAGITTVRKVKVEVV